MAGQAAVESFPLMMLESSLFRLYIRWSSHCSDFVQSRPPIGIKVNPFYVLGLLSPMLHVQGLLSIGA